VRRTVNLFLRGDGFGNEKAVPNGHVKERVFGVLSRSPQRRGGDVFLDFDFHIDWLVEALDGLILQTRAPPSLTWTVNLYCGFLRENHAAADRNLDTSPFTKKLSPIFISVKGYLLFVLPPVFGYGIPLSILYFMALKV
jgi:hypothetical protein